jgi:hypothetical protein
MTGQRAFYILGVNGGENERPGGNNEKAAGRYEAACRRAADAVGVAGYIIAERCFWGSPHVSILAKRVGEKHAMRELLRLHAAANRALFREYPPFLIWAPGVNTFVEEAIEDYGLTELASRYVQKRNRRDCLWRHYESSLGFSILFTKHPAARPSKQEREEICAKLAVLAKAQR